MIYTRADVGNTGNLQNDIVEFGSREAADALIAELTVEDDEVDLLSQLTRVDRPVGEVDGGSIAAMRDFSPMTPYWSELEQRFYVSPGSFPNLYSATSLAELDLGTVRVGTFREIKFDIVDTVPQVLKLADSYGWRHLDNVTVTSASGNAVYYNDFDRFVYRYTTDHRGPDVLTVKGKNIYGSEVQGTIRLVLSGDSGVTLIDEDVNMDGEVTALDALIIINALESGPRYADPNDPMDLDNNGQITAFDALIVINYLNRPTTKPSQPEQIAQRSIDHAITAWPDWRADRDDERTRLF